MYIRLSLQPMLNAISFTTKNKALVWVWVFHHEGDRNHDDRRQGRGFPASDTSLNITPQHELPSAITTRQANLAQPTLSMHF